MSQHDDPLLSEIKQLQREHRRAHEPNWDAMAAAISAECDAVEHQRQTSWITRLFSWRPLYYGAAAVAVMALVLVGVSSQMARGSLNTADLSITLPAPKHDVPPATPTTPLLRTAELSELDDAELDRLSDGLRSVFEAEDADWLGGADSASADLIAPDDSVLPEPNYEQFVDDLTEDQLDAVDSFLDSVKTG